jgi:acyl-CoA thioester hydrolase
MLKKATVEWSSPARYRDRLELRPSIDRWGTTSFDVRIDGVVGDRSVFTATIVYVSVSPRDHTPAPVPDDIRAVMSGVQSTGATVAGGATAPGSSSTPQRSRA